MQILLAGIERVLCFGIGLVFFYAGVSKLANPHDFAVVIAGYGLLPDPLLLPVAVALPVVEVLAALGLVIGIRGSWTVLTVLLVGFIAILSYGLLLGLDVDCGCFSSNEPEAAYKGLKPALFRDLVMLAGLICLFLYRSKLAHKGFHSLLRKEEEV